MPVGEDDRATNRNECDGRGDNEFNKSCYAWALTITSRRNARGNFS